MNQFPSEFRFYLSFCFRCLPRSRRHASRRDRSVLEYFVSRRGRRRSGRYRAVSPPRLIGHVSSGPVTVGARCELRSWHELHTRRGGTVSNCSVSHLEPPTGARVCTHARALPESRPANATSEPPRAPTGLPYSRTRRLLVLEVPVALRNFRADRCTREVR